MKGLILVSLFKKAWNNPERSKTFTVLIWILGILFISLIVLPIVLTLLKII